MKTHYIKNIKFRNFKCFQSLKVNDFNRVNLIGGKNNVGKTAFLEGLELCVSSNNCIDFAYKIYEMMKRRQLQTRINRYFELDFIYSKESYVDLVFNSNKLKIEYIEETQEYIEDIFIEDNRVVKYQPLLKLTVNNSEKKFPIESIIHRPNMIRRDRYTTTKSISNFIKSNATEEKEIAIYYGQLVDLNKENFFNESLKLFDENLIALKQKTTEFGVVLKILLKNREYPVLLSSLGEGLNRYIAILCAIWSSKDGFLFIDEIENGIHYTNYDKLWSIIFKASKMANCQLFITTHSKECIASFNKVNEPNEGAYLEFYINKKNNFITSKLRDSEQLEYALSHNSEFRGE